MDGACGRSVWISKAARGIKVDNEDFYGHIQVLLIKANSVIYICYIKYGGKTYVLTVRHDELGVGDDNDDMSSEAAGRGHVQRVM